jgi:GT2 family glycosyltransferase
VDLSMLVIAKGYRIVFCQEAYLWHKVQGLKHRLYHYLESRNRTYSFYKNFSRGVFLRMVPLFLLGDLLISKSYRGEGFVRVFVKRLRGEVSALGSMRSKFYEREAFSSEEQERILSSFLLPNRIKAGNRVMRWLAKCLSLYTSCIVRNFR